MSGTWVLYESVDPYEHSYGHTLPKVVVRYTDVSTIGHAVLRVVVGTCLAVHVFQDYPNGEGMIGASALQDCEGCYLMMDDG